MKTLFPIKEELELTIEEYTPIFSRIGYYFEKETNEAVGAKTLIRLRPKNNAKHEGILIIPWLRKWEKNVLDMVTDHPRLNLPPHIQNINEKDRKQAMLKLCREHDLYFLVVLNRPMGILFWLEKYHEIPDEHLELTYRHKGKGLDRIHLVRYTDYKFKKAKQFQQQLDKIFSK